MKRKVIRVVSELVVQLDERWAFHGLRGSRIRIMGLLPGTKADRQAHKQKLEALLLNTVIEIDQCLYVSDDTLCATVKLDGKPLQHHLPERAIPAFEPSRWVDEEETRILSPVHGGIPALWSNPVASLSPDDSPFFGNVNYPTNFWERGYDDELRLVRRLYSDTHYT